MSAAIAVIIPAYRVRSTILDVIRQMPALVERIIVVDDACPEGSGAYVSKHCNDRRIQVIQHPQNLGVGGATLTGYAAAREGGCTIGVKVDGDGQMPPKLIPNLVAPLLRGEVDYCKGNRFFFLASLREMPATRLFGNALLSLASKFSTGYWNIMDPTNGFTALHLSLLTMLETDKIHRRYFFETDMLFRLGLLRAVVRDMPMDAHYRGEISSLSLSRAALTFPLRHLRNTFKRLFYHYFLRDFSAGTVQLVSGLALFGFGVMFGGAEWLDSIHAGKPASAGTVMLAGLPVLAGIHLLVGALNWDIGTTPQQPIHPHLMDQGHAADATRNKK